jgi:hypothetical protein
MQRGRDVQEHLALNPMPPEFASTTATYLCNDCNVKSTGAYHFLGLQASATRLQRTRAPVQHYQTDTPLTLALSAERFAALTSALTSANGLAHVPSLQSMDVCTAVTNVTCR